MKLTDINLTYTGTSTLFDLSIGENDVLQNKKLQ